MDFKIPIGTLGHQTKIVEKKETASHIGTGLAGVFATPAMIALMEKTAFMSLESLLPEGFSTVGIEVNAKHLKASLPGSIITCQSEIVKTDGKKIHFAISASDDKGVIGSAKHIRYIIETKEFLNRLNER